MRNLAIFHPVIALAFWTLIVLMWIPVVRVKAALRREIKPDDFRFGESAAVPPYVSIPNRNFMNLLELPLLFYVVCIVLFVTGGASWTTVTIAWVFVVFRVVHSLIHLTYNHVIHRLLAYAVANVALLVLWLIVAVHILSAPPL